MLKAPFRLTGRLNTAAIGRNFGSSRPSLAGNTATAIVVNQYSDLYFA